MPRVGEEEEKEGQLQQESELLTVHVHRATIAGAIVILYLILSRRTKEVSQCNLGIKKRKRCKVQIQSAIEATKQLQPQYPVQKHFPLISDAYLRTCTAKAMHEMNATRHLLAFKTTFPSVIAGDHALLSGNATFCTCRFTHWRLQGTHDACTTNHEAT